MRLVWERERVHLNIGQRGRFSADASVTFKSDGLTAIPQGADGTCHF